MSSPASSHIHDGIRWRAQSILEVFPPGADVDEYRSKYGKDEGERRFHADHGPVSREVVDGNLLMTAGATALWTKLIGGAGTVFDATNAYIGVGDSSTAENAAHTDLQAATNKYRQVQDGTYPQVSGNQVTFKVTVGTSNGNFAWEEWGVFNAGAAGTMLNRKVASLGTKTSAASWAFTVNLTLS